MNECPIHGPLERVMMRHSDGRPPSIEWVCAHCDHESLMHDHYSPEAIAQREMANIAEWVKSVESRLKALEEKSNADR